MAVLQKIRNRGKILVSAVGLALFAFIAEEAVRSIQSTANENRQQVGEVYGESLSVLEFNDMVDEFAEFTKAQRGTAQLDEQAMYQVREQAWQNYVQTQIVKHESEKLGLMVTDAEMQDVLQKGSSQWLSQFARMIGLQQFDIATVRQILDQYEQASKDPNMAQMMESLQVVKNIWNFIEKRIREELLAQKFFSLIQTTVGNNTLAKACFDERVNEYDIVLAAIPFTAVSDDAVTVSDEDIKAKYNELKPDLYNTDEYRMVETISIKVVANDADRQALRSELQEVASTIGESTNISKFVRESGSEVPYASFPVSRKSLPSDIASRVDTMAVGQIEGPFVSNSDNTMNVVRLVNKTTAPDSVEYRQIILNGTDMAVMRAKADSIVAAINAGTPFDTLAAQQNQEGEKRTLTSAMYERQTVVGDDAKLLSAIINSEAGSLQVLEFPNACFILNVTDRRSFVDKYDVAIVKRTINFSKETYTAAYNQLSQFLAENQTAEAIRENAPKKNYNLQSNEVYHNTATVAGVQSTRDALRWAFDKNTNIDDVSPLYECGDNDNLLVCILKSITPKGTIEQANDIVSANIRQEVIKDKKAEKLIADMKGQSVEAVARMQGAVVDTVKHVTFANNAYIPAVRASEANIGGAIAGHKVGDEIDAIKGNTAVYTVKIVAKQTTAETYVEENERNRSAQMNMGYVMQNLLGDLFKDADVADHRYIFY